jgi:hypothetical protein
MTLDLFSQYPQASSSFHASNPSSNYQGTFEKRRGDFFIEQESVALVVVESSGFIEKELDWVPENFVGTCVATVLFGV